MTTPIYDQLHAALEGELEVVVTNDVGDQFRAMVFEVDATTARFLVFGDTRATSGVPLARLSRVRVLGRPSAATLRALAQLRGGAR